MDHSGREVTERTYLGLLQVIYFGYTHCPDICPIDAANIAQAVDLLGPAAKVVQPLFITIDPARDTAQRLSEWLAAVHPRFVGLTGPERAVAAATKAFRSEEHTSELQSLMRISYAVFCLKKKIK